MYLCCKKEKYAKIHLHHNLSIEVMDEYWIEILLPSHTVIDVDDRMCDILEYRKEELVGKDFRPLLLTKIMQKYLLDVYNTKLDTKIVNSTT